LFGPDKKSPIYKAPEIFTQAIIRPELQFYRCAIVTKSFVPDRTFSVGLPRSLVDDRELGNMELASVLEYNKGKALQPWELQYMDPSLVLVADKKDGVPAKLVMNNGAFAVVQGDMIGGNFKVSKFKNLSTSFKGNCVLQVELVKSESDIGHTSCDGDLYYVVVIDVLKHPEGVIGSFMSRWSWLQRMVKNHHAITTTQEAGKLVTCPTEWPFVLQAYYRLDTIDAFELIRDVKEGVVVQPVSAPAGAVSANAGSARYIKKRPTKDIKKGNSIVEVDLYTGEYIRDRPDKRYPNPQIVINGMLTAVKYDEFVAYAFAKAIGVPGADFRRVVSNVARSIPLNRWDPSDLVWAYHHRFDSEFRRLLPGVSAFLENAMANYCINNRGVESIISDMAEEEPEMVITTDDGYETIVAGPPGPLVEVGRSVAPVLDLHVGDFLKICPDIWSNDLPTIIDDLRAQFF
jgi:hypothetical protein